MHTKPLSTGKVAKAMQPHFFYVNRDMVRAWIEDGKLPGDRNPVVDEGWYFMEPDASALEKFLKTHFKAKATPEVIADIKKRLDLNVTPLRLSISA